MSRKLANTNWIERIHESPRFQQYKDAVCLPDEKIPGTWVCKGCLRKPQDPARSDLVILYCHGGGYINCRATISLPFELAVTEVLLSRGVTVSIFSLDYTLAPEGKFPTQLDQATEAYAHLVNDMGISPDKIALIGDSAGAHLVLSLLTHLATPLASARTAALASTLPKPTAGLFLFSPWLDLTNVHPAFARNADNDNLTKLAGDNAAAHLLRGSKTPSELLSPYLTFTKPDATNTRPSWSTILPPSVYISAGEDELFIGDIIDFAHTIQEDGIDNVELDVKEGEPHDWMFRNGMKRAAGYLENRMGEGGSVKVLMETAWEVGERVYGVVWGGVH